MSTITSKNNIQPTNLLNISNNLINNYQTSANELQTRFNNILSGQQVISPTSMLDLQNRVNLFEIDTLKSVQTIKTIAQRHPLLGKQTRDEMEAIVGDLYNTVSSSGISAVSRTEANLTVATRSLFISGAPSIANTLDHNQLLNHFEVVNTLTSNLMNAVHKQHTRILKA